MFSDGSSPSVSMKLEEPSFYCEVFLLFCVFFFFLTSYINKINLKVSENLLGNICPVYCSFF